MLNEAAVRRELDKAYNNRDQAFSEKEREFWHGYAVALCGVLQVKYIKEPVIKLGPDNTMYVDMPKFGWQKVTVIGQDTSLYSSNYGKYLVKNEKGASFFVQHLDLHKEIPSER